MADRDEEQATQEVADYLRRQEWEDPTPYAAGDDATKERITNLWWVSRAEDVLDAVAEAGAKLFNGSLELDDEESDILRARIEAEVTSALQDGAPPEFLIERVLIAVKGFINGQVV